MLKALGGDWGMVVFLRRGGDDYDLGENDMLKAHCEMKDLSMASQVSLCSWMEIRGVVGCQELFVPMDFGGCTAASRTGRSNGAGGLTNQTIPCEGLQICFLSCAIKLQYPLTKMSVIGSLVFCTDCGNLLEPSKGIKDSILKCECCGTENKGLSA